MSLFRRSRTVRPASRLRRGVAAVELALTLPALLLLVSGLVDLGAILTQRVALVEASHAALRRGVAVRPGGDAVGTARDELELLLSDNGFSVASGGCEIDLAVVTLAGTDALSLELACPFRASVGLLPLPAEIHVNQVMLVEHPGA